MLTYAVAGEKFKELVSTDPAKAIEFSAGYYLV